MARGSAQVVPLDLGQGARNVTFEAHRDDAGRVVVSIDDDGIARLLAQILSTRGTVLRAISRCMIAALDETPATQ